MATGTTGRGREGLQALAEAVPAHLAHVRSLVIDVMSPEQLRRLGRAAHRIMSRNGLWHDHEGNR
jgi:hypothetical protein